jgi:hypothetical protein
MLFVYKKLAKSLRKACEKLAKSLRKACEKLATNNAFWHFFREAMKSA